MNERKYSVSEIDSMRRLVRDLCDTGMPYMPQDRAVEVEERLRTYMMHGADPEELARAAADHQSRLWDD